MTRRGSRALSLLFLIAGAAAPTWAAGRINLFVGASQFQQSTWGSDGVFEGGGLQTYYGGAGWPVQLATGFSHFGTAFEAPLSASQQGPGQKASVNEYVEELSLGVSKLWRPGVRTRLFVGAGASRAISHVRIEAVGSRIQDFNSALGGYAEAGVFWKLGSRINLGFDLHGTTANQGPIFTTIAVNPLYILSSSSVFHGQSGTASNYRIALTMGWGWPKGD